MKKTLTIILVIIIYSCKKGKNYSKDRIDIFLTESRLESYKGQKISDNNQEIEYLKRLDSSKIIDLEITKLDTLSRNFIIAGPFEALISDLQHKPLISNEEITKYDLKTNTFFLSNKAEKRIKELGIHSNHGKQFVMTVNGKPKLTGYLFNLSLSSFKTCHTNQILILGNQLKLKKSDFQKNEIDLLADYPEIYEILKNRTKKNLDKKTIYNTKSIRFADRQ